MQSVSLIDNVTFLLTLQFLIQILVKYATLSHSLPVPIGDLRFFFQKFSSIRVSDKFVGTFIDSSLSEADETSNS